MKFVPIYTFTIGMSIYLLAIFSNPFTGYFVVFVSWPMWFIGGLIGLYNAIKERKTILWITCIINFLSFLTVIHPIYVS